MGWVAAAPWLSVVADRAAPVDGAGKAPRSWLIAAETNATARGSWRRCINSWPSAPELDPKPRLLPVGTAGAPNGYNETPRLDGAWGRRHSRAGPGAGLGTASSAP